MKYFLLIAGSRYYPDYGDRDWIGTFETIEEAEEHYRKIEYNKEPLYRRYDWHCIVDLRDWINK